MITGGSYLKFHLDILYKCKKKQRNYLLSGEMNVPDYESIYQTERYVFIEDMVIKYH